MAVADCSSIVAVGVVAVADVAAGVAAHPIRACSAAGRGPCLRSWRVRWWRERSTGMRKPSGRRWSGSGFGRETGARVSVRDRDAAAVAPTCLGRGQSSLTVELVAMSCAPAVGRRARAIFARGRKGGSTAPGPGRRRVSSIKDRGQARSCWRMKFGKNNQCGWAYSELGARLNPGTRDRWTSARPGAPRCHATSQCLMLMRAGAGEAAVRGDGFAVDRRIVAEAWPAR